MNWRWIGTVGIAAVALAVYWPVVWNGFVGYDDGEYVVENPHVRGGIDARWAFTAAHSNNWHPLTWISHQVDVAIFGMNPAGHHAVNLGLHVLNTALLFWWLSGLTGTVWRSAFVAAVFGAHPLHVESVAWIAERKDVLSTCFGLLALLAWGPGWRRYAVTATCFALSLLAKPMLVTLPVLLMLVDWWPRKRGLRILEKLPLFLLSAGSAAATLWAQRSGGAMAEVGALPVGLRLSSAAVSYWRYVGKMLWPIDLAVFYPFPAAIPRWQVTAAAAGLVVVSGAVWWLRRSRPWLAVGWAWYVVTLVPVIGIVQVGMQSMADRYMYVPMIGLLLAVAWEMGRALPVVGPATVAACAVLSWRQIPVWQDGLTLFTRTAAVTRDNFVAHDNLGVELDRRGRADEAIAEYRETLRIRPGDRVGSRNLAAALFEKGERLFNAGKKDEAYAALEEGLRYRPNAAARTNVGLILLERQKIEEAIAHFRQALAEDPSIVRAQVGLGVALATAGRDAEARRAFETAVKLAPENTEARFDLGMVAAAMGDRATAVRELREVLRLKPGDPGATQALAMLGAH